ncbi:MAG: hypothetical protein E6R08_04925 [Nevskiaceae bacterium]|nr:MAG: hypothetical protein E6R08_04925 [Nevskiaceae bacterium]
MAAMPRDNQDFIGLAFGGTLTFPLVGGESPANCTVNFDYVEGLGEVGRIALSGPDIDGGRWGFDELMLCTPGTTRFRTRPDVAPYVRPAHVQVLVHRDKLRIVDDGGHKLLFVLGEWHEGPEDGNKKDAYWCSFCGLLGAEGRAPRFTETEIQLGRMLRSDCRDSAW